jgi:hypothetical protein
VIDTYRQAAGEKAGWKRSGRQGGQAGRRAGGQTGRRARQAGRQGSQASNQASSTGGRKRKERKRKKEPRERRNGTKRNSESIDGSRMDMPEHDQRPNAASHLHFPFLMGLGQIVDMQYIVYVHTSGQSSPLWSIKPDQEKIVRKKK